MVARGSAPVPSPASLCSGLFCSSPRQPVGRMSILPTRSGYQKKPEMGVRRVEFCGQGNVEFEGVLSMLGGLVSKEMEDTPSAERK